MEVVHLSVPFRNPHDNNLKIFNNTWENNYGNYSSAVDISATYTDQTLYRSTLYWISPYSYFYRLPFCQQQHGPKSCTAPTTLVVFTTFNVFFEGTVTFLNNKYTALKLVSATLILRAGTSLHFISNNGVRGGAVALYGFSTLVGSDNNYAMLGGGIFHQTIEERDYFEGNACFIVYGGSQQVHTRNLTFKFINNIATQKGSACIQHHFMHAFLHIWGIFTIIIYQIF